MKIRLAADFLRMVPPIRSMENAEAEAQVRELIKMVQRQGDEALRRLTQRFDGVELETLEVPLSHCRKAWGSLPSGEQQGLQQAAARIRAFHEKQRPSDWTQVQADGSQLGQIHRPLDRVGIYVPGGAAPYPSSVLMNAIPAVVAGVKEIVMVSPPRQGGEVDDRVLATAYLAGVHRVFRVGGVQAVAALAYGTETVPRVDKITGPGNLYVTLAKKQVYGQVDIDMLAGPSEIMIVADTAANPGWIAADLLSQAEHDPRSWAVFVTTDADLRKQVETELKAQLADLPRGDTARQALEAQGWLVLAEDRDEAVRVVNHFAPEHLEIMTRDPWELVAKIRHAGAIFVGPWSPEAVGDYTAGPNHVLPTGGTARFNSALGVDAFMKTTNLIAMTREGLEKVANLTEEMADWEGFAAHGRAVKIRRDQS